MVFSLNHVCDHKDLPCLLFPHITSHHITSLHSITFYSTMDVPLSSPLSPNGALPMFLKPKSQREQQEPSSSSRPLSSPRRNRTTSKSSSSPTKNKKQQHRSSRTNNRLDMRYDDDEFAYTAHLVIQYMAEQHPDELLDIDDDAGCATFADVLQLWQCGEETSTSPS